jgi:protein O-GlcNAc transferase
VLDLWSKLLRELPDARLMLSGTFAADAGVRQRLLARFAARGIQPERLQLLTHRPFGDYLALHHEVDVLLDPFPFTGHTTTLHALWMGVVPLSLVGQTHVSRRPLSILSNLQLTELLAHTPEQYISIGRELCRDLDRLAELRATMRQRLLDSPLTDAKTFTSNLKAAYRQTWSRCASQPDRR